MKNPEVNTGRQYQLDLLKAENLICIVLCHTVIKLAVHRPDHSGEFGYFLGDSVLGCVLAGAYTFMFAMGVGIVFSKRNAPTELLKRGIKLYVLGYVLNFFRFGLYSIVDHVLKHNYTPGFWQCLLYQDIFQFAGLALIFTAFLKKLRLNEMVIAIVGFLLSCIEGKIPDIQSGNAVFDLFMGTFVTASKLPSHFAFLNWYVFVAVGMLFAKIIRQIRDEGRFYRYLMLVSGLIATLFSLGNVRYGIYYLNNYKRYYSVSPLEAVGYLSFTLLMLSVFYFIVRRFGTEKTSVFLTMSKNMTYIFFLHWCFVGMIEYVLCYIFQLKLSYPIIYIIGVVNMIVSSWIADKLRTSNLITSILTKK